MSTDANNPFNSPTTPGGFAPTPDTSEIMRQTRPWVFFMAIMGAIGASLMALGAVVALIGGAVSGDPATIGVAVLYGVMAVIYIFPVMYLFRYASSIKAFLHSGLAAQLNEALTAQKAFWKFVGIFTAVTMAIYVIIILFAIAFGVFAAIR